MRRRVHQSHSDARNGDREVVFVRSSDSPIAYIDLDIMTSVGGTIENKKARKHHDTTAGL